MGREKRISRRVNLLVLPDDPKPLPQGMPANEATETANDDDIVNPHVEAQARKGRAGLPSQTLTHKNLKRDNRRGRQTGLDDEVLRRRLEQERPSHRTECKDGPRPCLFVSCRYHLYLEVNACGTLRLNFPGLEVWELPESCALDVAEEGGVTLDEVGQKLNVTRERARQLQVKAIQKLKHQL